MRLRVALAISNDDVRGRVQRAVVRAGHEVVAGSGNDPGGDVVVTMAHDEAHREDPGRIAVHLPDAEYTTVARLLALFESNLPRPTTLPLEDGALDLESGIAARSGVTHRLSGLELELVRYLFIRGLASRETLLRDVWGYAGGVDTNVVATTIYRIRKKLERDPTKPRHLVTRPIGFELVPAQKVTPDTMRPRRTNALPPGNPTFGREELLAGLVTRLRSGARLVTLVGAPGVGKSRLARVLAYEQATAHPERHVWWCEAPSQCNPSELAAELFRAIWGAPLSGAEHALDRVAQALNVQLEPLVVIDRADEAPEAVRVAVASWLEACPALKLVVAGRETLGLVPEQVVSVPPLTREHSVAMLRDRLGDRCERTERAPLESIAELAEDTPLALEIAAGLGDAMSPWEIAEALSDKRDAFADGSAKVPGFRASFGTSWQRLEPEERALFRACAIFDGGFSIAAAAAVSGAEVPHDGVAARLARLADKHVVTSHCVPGRFGRVEFRIPRALRALAGEDTEEAAATSDERYAERHADHFLTTAERWAELEMRRGPLTVRAVAELVAMQANLRQAIAWTRRRDDPRCERLLACHLCGLAWEGPSTDALALAEDLIARPPRDPIGRGRLLVMTASLLRTRSEHHHVASLAAEAVRLLAAEPQPAGVLAGALLGWCHDDDEVAERAFAEAERLAHQIDPSGAEGLHGIVNHGRGGRYFRTRDRVRALEAAETTARISERARSILHVAAAHTSAARSALELGRLELASQSIDAARALDIEVEPARPRGERRALAAMIDHARGDLDGAVRGYEEALTIQRPHGVTSNMRATMAYLALASIERGELDAAGRTLAGARTSSDRPEPEALQTILAAVAEALRARREGRWLTPQEIEAMSPAQSFLRRALGRLVHPTG